MITKLHQVPKEVFTAYLKGGRLWPQKRGGINIAILSAYTKNALPLPDFMMFAKSQFNQEQIQSTRKVMIQDHLKGGIYLPHTIPDSMMNKQWYKAKAYALISLVHAIEKFEQENLFFKKEDIKDEVDIVEMAIHLNHYFSEHKKLTKYTLIREMSNEANRILLKHTDLAKLFILSYYPQDSFEESLKSWKKIDCISKSYGLFPLTCKREELYIRCTQIITNILENNLRSQFPYSNDWIVRGFIEEKIGKI